MLADSWLRLRIPLEKPVLGLEQLSVCVTSLAEFSDHHARWLMDSTAGTGRDARAAAGEVHYPPGALMPTVLGFDTEFVGDQLALVQLCCRDRALLLRVPQLRSPTSSSPQQPPQQQPRNNKERKRQQRQQQQQRSGAAASASSSGGGFPPFQCPGQLQALLCDPSIPKAAAEAWQDALMLFAAFGVKLRHGLDLTAACPPTKDDSRKKLGLFAILEHLLPGAGLEKDRTIDHSRWFATQLEDKQVRYGALDAFVSYAAGVAVACRTGGGGGAPAGARVDLSLPEEWEVALAANLVCASQYLDAQSPDRTKHDWERAVFRPTNQAKGLVLEVRMSRFKTRLQRHCFVDVRLPDGRAISGKCVYVHGKTAHVGRLKWRASKADVKHDEVSEVHQIDMSDGSDTPEEEAIKALLAQLMCGEASLKECRLAAGLFGGGPLAAVAVTPGSAGGRGPARDAATLARPAVLDRLQALLLAGRVNDSQRAAVEEVLVGRSCVQLVQGPPGTGKTTVISHAVALWLELLAPRMKAVGSGRLQPALVCAARSNVAAKNIALAMLKRGLKDFRLVVSKDFHFEWHEEQYRGQLQDVLIVSDQLKNKDVQRRLVDVQVFVATVSMIASKGFRKSALHGKEVVHILVDEASQIYAGDLMLPLKMYGKHLGSLSLFGDDRQLPPFGSEWDGAQLPSMFDHLPATQHLSHGAVSLPGAPASTAGGHAAPALRPQPNAFTVGPPLRKPLAACGGVRRLMLSVSYRLPPQLCGFISGAMYGGLLTAGRAAAGG
ncbi:hypothetical protein GPECTOR_15g407 [Gonium pectorale]|uniref:DNA2/NAM7 helicase helicase domain-containing protein n=1 Tax=Gonium pectorale TaxID=33097 RepID=A0A150GLL4_GONPE|nr:hypothetical protein GPECTOR_15g407 [Gonium pectorale]|eukprot:KXZ50723.1 hypothetical protein GPECTOR_15g407 [Gonium pectorale]